MLPGKLLLTGMVFFGHHGNWEEEQRLGQRFEVDIEVEYDLERVAETDDLADTVDLGGVYRAVKEVVEGPPLHLVETLAARIARRVIDGFPCDGVRVKVKKPNVPIPGPLDYEGAEVYLRAAIPP